MDFEQKEFWPPQDGHLQSTYKPPPKKGKNQVAHNDAKWILNAKFFCGNETIPLMGDCTYLLHSPIKDQVISWKSWISFYLILHSNCHHSPILKELIHNLLIGETSHTKNIWPWKKDHGRYLTEWRLKGLAFLCYLLIKSRFQDEELKVYLKVRYNITSWAQASYIAVGRWCCNNITYNITYNIIFYPYNITYNI